jgi:oligosaccharyltransferase complex subunit alpha (ribophorin I)
MRKSWVLYSRKGLGEYPLRTCFLGWHEPSISDVDFSTPFPAISNWTGTHATYLDTVGRPKLTFTYKDLTLKHVDYIIVGFLLFFPVVMRSLCLQVSYRLSWIAHLRKPICVGTVFFAFFVFGMMSRRVDLTLQHKKT